MPLLSIIVPIYNVELYLPRCIDSILAQTFTDFELILVDDGSSDSCGTICDHYATKDSRVVVIHKKNGGLSDARNAGLDIARGNYIGFVDGDDMLCPDMYDVLYTYHQTTDADIICCKFLFFSDDGTINEIWPQIDQDYLFTDKEYIHSFFPFIKRVLMPSVCNKLYNKNVFANIRFPKGNYFEDAYIQLETYTAAKRIAVVNKVLYKYRKRGGSITEKMTYKKVVDQLSFSVNHLMYFEQLNDVTQSEYALAQVVNHYLMLCFARKIYRSKIREEEKHYTSVYYRHFIKIMVNPQICRLKKTVILLNEISPHVAYKICIKFFPECIPIT